MSPPPFIDQLLATLNTGCATVFGYPATYTAIDGTPYAVTGAVLNSGLNESSAPGYYCNFFVAVGVEPGNLPVTPQRFSHLTLNGVTYFVNDVVADKVGNGFHLILHRDL